MLPVVVPLHSVDFRASATWLEILAMQKMRLDQNVDQTSQRMMFAMVLKLLELVFCRACALVFEPRCLMREFSDWMAAKGSSHEKQAPSWHSCPHPSPFPAVSSLLREAALRELETLYSPV